MSENLFVKAATQAANETVTDNGMKALRSTGESLVDAFGTLGAMRDAEESDVISKFEKAYADDRLLAMKLLMYVRDIRGGMGERKTFKVIANWLAKYHRADIEINMGILAEYGRWDDLYTFVGTPAEKEAFKVMFKQFASDLENANAKKPVSLLAKWLKSEGASSPETVRLAKKTAKEFGLTSKEYRKGVSFLRAYLGVTERLMSAKEFEKIDFSKVPALAIHKYRESFSRQVPDKWQAYLDSVEKGEEKVNAGTIYPYELVLDVFNNKSDKLVEEQWKALPNYIEGDNNILVMADTSGSMTSYGYRPIAAAVGLAIYFAERNHGAFQDLFLTFSSNPSFIKINRNTSLKTKIRDVSKADWGMNTDIEAAMKLILNEAVENNVPAKDMPKSLIIISDMQFDYCALEGANFYEHVRKEFEDKGYDVPNVVFWNVNAKNAVFHATSEWAGIQLASGYSPTVFKSILSNVDCTAFEMVLDTLNSPRYSAVRIAE